MERSHSQPTFVVTPGNTVISQDTQHLQRKVLIRIIVLHAPCFMERNSPCNTYSNCNEPNSKVKLKAGPVHARDTTENE